MGVLAASALGMAGLGAPLRSAIPFTVNPAPGDEVPAPVRFQAPRVDLALTLKGAVREAALTLVNTSQRGDRHRLDQQRLPVCIDPWNRR